MTKVYVLLQDIISPLGHVAAGTEGILAGDWYFFPYIGQPAVGGLGFKSSNPENYPEWFREKWKPYDAPAQQPVNEGLHTKGDWYIVENYPCLIFSRTERNPVPAYPIVECRPTTVEGEAKANAELIVKAVNAYQNKDDEFYKGYNLGLSHRAENDHEQIEKLQASNKELAEALEKLMKIAAKETANLVAWDGAEPLDKAIDKAQTALNNHKSLKP